MADQPKFIDLTHHLAPEVLVRKSHPLKDIIRISWSRPNLISLTNGDPHSSLYPIRRIEYEVPSVVNEDPVPAWRSAESPIPNQILTSDDPSVSGLLQRSLAYGAGSGLDDAIRAATEINNAYHTAPHHVVTMTLGNADAISKCFRMLGSPGDHFLADEFTYVAMPLAAEAHAVKWVPVRLDAGGIMPDELERILANWDPKRGRRPHVLYTTPCGQNPTGSTLSPERRKRIYELSQKYDLIIVEDDPYYFLQYPEEDKPLPTSFLSMDVDGRVIRIDSFSKILSPGLRLGWITSPPALQPQLIKFIDFSSQHPSGLPQHFVIHLLRSWGPAGFRTWTRSLCADYRRRRDLLMRLFAETVAPGGWASAEVPEAGMFVWICVHLDRHPRFRRAETHERAGRLRGAPRTNGAVLMDELFEACLEAGLVVCPAKAFVVPGEAGYGDEGFVPIEDRSNFIRATFAGSEETMEAGIPILGRVLQEFFTGAPSSG